MDNIYKFIKEVNKYTDNIWKDAVTSDNGWVKQGEPPVDMNNPKSITDYFLSLVRRPNVIHVDFQLKKRSK